MAPCHCSPSATARKRSLPTPTRCCLMGAITTGYGRGSSHLPVASSVRMADLSHRLAAFEEPEGLRIEPLSHALLAELAALFFESDNVT